MLETFPLLLISALAPQSSIGTVHIRKKCDVNLPDFTYKNDESIRDQTLLLQATKGKITKGYFVLSGSNWEPTHPDHGGKAIAQKVTDKALEGEYDLQASTGINGSLKADFSQLGFTLQLTASGKRQCKLEPKILIQGDADLINLTVPGMEVSHAALEEVKSALWWESKELLSKRLTELAEQMVGNSKAKVLCKTIMSTSESKKVRLPRIQIDWNKN